MSNGFLKFQNIYFTYPSAQEPIFTDLSFHLTTGWTGIIGPNGTGKSTLLKLATGILEPETGRIESTRQKTHAIYCEQRTDHPPTQLEEMLFANEKAASILKNGLNMEEDWPYRWETLSHGERKRAQVGTALWLEPEILAIDEPFNHLDTEARAMIAKALTHFKGIALLTTHDRDIMDQLCSQCLFMDPPNVIKRHGGYSQTMKAITDEQQSMEKELANQKQKLNKMKKELNRRKQKEQQTGHKNSKRKLHKKDHDGKSKIDGARLTGKDATAGKLKKQMETNINHFHDKMNQISVKKKYDMGIWFENTISPKDFLFHIPPGQLQLGEEKKLTHPELSMKPTDRISISGPNGTGKSTLIKKITTSLNLPPNKLVYIPQEIPATQAQQILNETKELPHQQLGTVMTAINRLGSHPHRLLTSQNPSPGETRKLLLSLGISKAPHLIIMDEPTNHMDLPSIECLEQALTDCPCALLLISHDHRFLNTLTTTHWSINLTARQALLDVCPPGAPVRGAPRGGSPWIPYL